MFFQLCLFIVWVNGIITLQCQTASPSKCRFNSTCKYESEICNRTLKSVRGGIYCSTLINSLDEILIENMGCMYDQETSKSCQNQTQCFMKFTNQEKNFLHCCCNKDFCNLNLNLSNPVVIVATDLSINNKENNKKGILCEYLKCPTGVLLSTLISMGIVLIIVVVIYLLIRLKPISMFKLILRLIGAKSADKINCSPRTINEDQQITSDENEQMICKENKEICREDLIVHRHLIKQGKFCQIYEGEYRNEKVAIKILKENHFNDQIRCLFNHEKDIYLLPFFRHENLLKFFGYLTIETNYYLIFAFAQHGSLKDFLRHHLINEEKELIFMCQQLANGLEYLHQDFTMKLSSIETNVRSSIAHRDLKSENILMFQNNKLVICDFGMSIQVDQTEMSPNEQQQIGTIRYMAPEILAGTIGNEFNALLTTDIYALGLILWEIISRLNNLDPNEIYLMPYEQQLTERNSNENPTINEMLQILHLESPLNRPAIRSTWRKNDKIVEIIKTIEQCWDSVPEGRINSGLVAHRMRQLQQ